MILHGFCDLGYPCSFHPSKKGRMSGHACGDRLSETRASLSQGQDTHARWRDARDWRHQSCGETGFQQPCEGSWEVQ